MNLISITVLQDNYIWILVDRYDHCLIVDPGDAIPVLKAIKENKWKPKAILLTHHHDDHVNGVVVLHSHFPYLRIYGPKETKDNGTTQIVRDGDIISVLNREFSVFSTPGHTLGHICFFSFPYLFCGDTLFSGGCGRVLEGTPKQMYQSLQKINQLPANTVLCCAHEYTLANMEFAISILPEDMNIKKYYWKIRALREKNKKTLPVILKNEQNVNIFLRVNDTNLIKKILKEEGEIYHPEERFAWLRFKKDKF